MTDEQPVQQYLISISFPSLFRAQEFLTASQGLAAAHKLRLEDAVVVVKDDDGRTRVQETIDPQPGRTALSGSMWTGLFGLVLGGPVGWLAGVAIGAGAGALTAKLVDLGISDEWVEHFRASVQPGTATVALLATDVDHEALVAEVERFAGGQLVYSNLDDTMLERLRDALGETQITRTPE